MDPFSHAALGRTLVALAPEERRSRALAVAGVLGALSLDIDAVFMPFGWDLYLRVHEIGTHSLIGTLGCAILTGSLVQVFARERALWWLVAGAWLGAASHLFLDLVSSARVRVFWPIADAHVSIPLVAMADPWLASILIVGAATVLIGSRQRRRIASLVIAAAGAFLLSKALLASRAIDAYRAATDISGHVESRLVEARWAALSEWHIFDRAAGRLRFWRISATSHQAELVLSWPAAAASQPAGASQSLSTVRNFLRVHDLTLSATVARPNGRRWVIWSDVRYCWSPDGDGASGLDPIIEDSQGARLACALWFGGEFDANGKAIQQLIRVGRFTQTRAIGE